ncbi:thiolase family protein [Mycobacterium avium]|uniref:Thiolase C-terminal domain-containing protein n=1 Tax=Mycolicibacterium paratuberculosis (strain ATCC BAA-968 / K-10) TaxID=262316 RepID=Q73RY1_MYCPA|nr:thiolase family protein [Mycobacterium avium]ETA93988.1 thiolase [Mycobacterium avium subsp. paratuberculosis 10-4404]ETA97590.1 thiolase [Mycobacterium avium subsp. paratuberculosis 10-5864]ETB08224.1 thiolase [Mycobacterium avium subsp. paratuberculosis 08-8281]ETB25301.1 thiolase [Mycobacterium avium subsp. paratuberculosis 10-5975]ETB33748.1 thiolase [Mycobacterium avium subsp. paratuberculosis 11-1786]
MKTRPAKRTAAIVGVHNTRQGRRLDGETSRSLALKAIRGALDDAGLCLDDVDGISAGPLSTALIYDLRLGPAWQGLGFGVGMITEAATAIEHGMAEVVVLVASQAGEYRDHEATAPWTRPENEFVAPWGMFTTAEFALIARRHMHVYGTTREQLSTVAATIRNNGSRNPEAVYYRRGPFTPDDITASRPIADPFHLLDCATTSEGGCALVLANLEKVDTASQPIYVLGSGADFHGPSYQHPPAFDLAGRRGGDVNGVVGRRAADCAFAHAGLRRDDVDVLELYDPFSFEIIRQLEAFGFCEDGEGGPFVADGHIALDGSHPVTTDGGTMSFSHAGSNPQMMQRAIRAVQQLRGQAGELQVPDAHIALCSNGGAGALFTTVLILGDEPR